jgi:hypothetical protein
MNTAYEIIRITPAEKAVTVLLEIDGKTLQEDVVVDDLTNLDTIDDAIQLRLEKFADDLEVARQAHNTPVHPDLQDLVDKHTHSFKEEAN